MYRRRLLAILSASMIVLVPATGAAAAEAAAPATEAEGENATGGTGTSSSEASANGAHVEGVATVSGTSARTADGGSADATVLSLFGEEVVGGSQEGDGESSGEILTTGENEQGSLTVGGWNAAVADGTSSSRAALADGNLGGDSGLSVTVLESNSEATGEGSRASTTALIVSAGDDAVHLELLGAETSSDEPGGAYLIAVNGQRILTSDDANGSCSIAADPVVRLLCLYAAAVEAGDVDAPGGNEAGVAQFGLIDDALTGETFTATALAGGDGGPGDPEPPTPQPRVDDPTDPGTLPVTGANALLSLLGLGTIGAGAGLRRWTRR